MKNNPLLYNQKNTYNSVPFKKIKSHHFLPAIKHFIKKTENNIAIIYNNNIDPDFNNTILAFETSNEDLNYVSTIYRYLYGSEANDDIRKLINHINPLLTKLLILKFYLRQISTGIFH